MAENITYTALAMDRDEPLGNSLDVFGRRALHVKVANKTDEPIPVSVTDSEPGTPAFWSTQTTTDPGNEKVILTDTLIASTFFWSCTVVCRQESTFLIKVNGSVIGSGRTGAATPNASFTWNPRRNFAIGDIFEITIKSRAGSPIVDCEAYLMALTQP